MVPETGRNRVSQVGPSPALFSGSLRGGALHPPRAACCSRGPLPRPPSRRLCPAVAFSLPLHHRGPPPGPRLHGSTRGSDFLGEFLPRVLARTLGRKTSSRRPVDAALPVEAEAQLSNSEHRQHPRHTAPPPQHVCSSREQTEAARADRSQDGSSRSSSDG